MGGVDLADILVELYRIPLRAKRYYMRIVSWCINVAVVNGWLLYRRHQSQRGLQPEFPLLQFQCKIAASLTACGKNIIRKRGRLSLDINWAPAPNAKKRKIPNNPNNDKAVKSSKATASGDSSEPKEGRKRTSTRVLSPSEVKMAGLAPHVDSAILGPSTSQATDASSAGVFGGAVSDDEYNYEDDFEDYESDFEEDSSDNSADDDLAAGHGNTASGTDLRAQGEEKKMDSGNYDMAESRRRSQQVRELQVAMDRENAELQERQRSHYYHEKEAPTSLIDEGFVEESKEDWRKTVPKQTNFINFQIARQKQKEKKVAARTKQRGEELLSMIRLDEMKYKLFEMKPVPYDTYMSSYGRANTAQAHVQTRDDNLSEEVQTEQIFTKDMWTQKPPAFSAGDMSVLKQDRLGVGGPTCVDAQPDGPEPLQVDTELLSRFMARVGPCLLRLLAEESAGGQIQPPRQKLPFSRGFIPLDTGSVACLAGRPVTLARFPPDQPSVLLTVHKALEDSPETPDSHRCLICIWDLLNPTSPDKILAARQEVKAACFESARASLVLAGLEDGALCVWDLREKTITHQEVTDKQQWLLRSPTYSTAEVLRADGHLTPVIAIQPLVEREVSAITDYSPTQVCSLEEAGVVMVWTVIRSFEKGLKSGAADQDLGLAHWGRVRLVRSSVIILEDSLPGDEMLGANLQCLDLQLLSEDTNHLFISTNTGHVIHRLKVGGKPSPKVYNQLSGTTTCATCIETCPFGLPIFLVGGGDGSLRMHRREKSRPLSTMEGTADAPGEGPSILSVQWSRSRSTVFYILDAFSRIHVWDLSQSDLSPQYSVEIKGGGVSAVQLAPDSGKGKTPPQMVITKLDGTIELHQLKEEYCRKSKVEEEKELKRFKLFTDRL